MPVPDDKRAVLITPSAAKRIFGATREVENDPGDSVGKGSPTGAMPITQFILVASGTVDATTGYYPAIVRLYNSVSKAWDNKGAIWAMSGDTGGTLEAKQYYARCVGTESTDGVPVFATMPCCTAADVAEDTFPCTCLDFAIFTIAGTSGCTGLNDSFCLTKVGTGCSYGLLRGDLNFIFGLDVYADGTARLQLWICCVDPIIYTTADFNCGSTTVFTREVGGSEACAVTLGLPATITVFDTNSSGICSDPPAGGVDCTTCAKTSATVSIGTGTNGTCTGCNLIGAPPFAPLVAGPCSFTGTGNNMNCGSGLHTMDVTLIDNGVSGWDLYLVDHNTTAVIAIYSLGYSSWSCTAVNTLGLAFQGAGCATLPVSCTVQLS